MSEKNAALESSEKIDLKDPVLAAFLAWLLPGLGHWYQGRRGKAILFFVCIMSLFVYGVYLGGNRELGFGRAVYLSFRPEEWRLPYICQVCVGLPALPACVQSVRMNNNREVLFNGFMSPPRPLNSSSEDRNNANRMQPTLDDLLHDLNQYFELASVFTMIAGLLNVLAIYDAWGGPVFVEPEDKKASSKKEEEATS